MTGPLPARYAEPWRGGFVSRVVAALRPGIRVLDVGSGAQPTIPRDQRPDGCFYVGLDRSAHELARASDAAYDDIVVADICRPLPTHAGRFDLVLSWQVLEHVPSMHAALATQHEALTPGGRMLAMLSGAWSFYALAARVMPYRMTTSLQVRLLDAVPDSKFHTHYDGCTDRALRRILACGGWETWEIVPHYRAGGYLGFSRPLQRAYLVYENWAAHSRRANLATHYFVEAVA